jgi:hypothetical protein
MITIPFQMMLHVAAGGRDGFKTPSLLVVNALAFENSAGTNNNATRKVRNFLIMACSC